MNKFHFGTAAATAALAATVSGAAPPTSSSLSGTLPSVPVTVTNSPAVTVANPVTIANPLTVSGTVNAAISSVVSVQSAFPRTPAMISLITNNTLDLNGPSYTVPAGQYLVVETVTAGLVCKGGGVIGSAKLVLVTPSSSGTPGLTGIPLISGGTGGMVTMRIVLTAGTQILMVGGIDGCPDSGGNATLFGYQMSSSSPSLEP